MQLGAGDGVSVAGDEASRADVPLSAHGLGGGRHPAGRASRPGGPPYARALQIEPSLPSNGARGRHD